MIDLHDVTNLQNKYISVSLPDEHKMFKFISYENLWNETHNFKNNYTFLFSSYSLSEINSSCRETYYNLLFKNIEHGILFWNTEKIDLPDCVTYTWDTEDPQTGACNRTVYFSQKV
jgi:hypothetical protein